MLPIVRDYVSSIFILLIFLNLLIFAGSCSPKTAYTDLRAIPEWSDIGIYLDLDEARKNKKLNKILNDSLDLSELEGIIPKNNISKIIGGIKLPEKIDNIFEFNINQVTKDGLSLFIDIKKDNVKDKNNDKDNDNTKIFNLEDSLNKKYEEPINSINSIDIYKPKEGFYFGHFNNGILISNEKSIDENINRLIDEEDSKNITKNKHLYTLINDLSKEYNLFWMYFSFDDRIHDIINQYWSTLQFLFSASSEKFQGSLKPYGGFDNIKKIVDSFSTIYIGIKTDNSLIYYNIGIHLSGNIERIAMDQYDDTNQKAIDLSDIISKFIKEISRSNSLDEKDKELFNKITVKTESNSAIISISLTAEELGKIINNK